MRTVAWRIGAIGTRMANIDITRRHQLGSERARAIVEQIVEELSQRFPLHGAWEGDRFLIRRGGVDGEIAVGENEVRVRARLGLMYGMLKGTIEDEIRHQLDRHFA
ncbi:MAG TPA: polyhydroxyalkanoic acid system family protein [Rhodanobacteraceae bacterium]|nr:polyhydroxyalkanoic acid system family protein [Rhodanobacteraceae bacterium]